MTLIVTLSGCSKGDKTEVHFPPHDSELIILGNVQDAGSPHIGCKKACCVDLTKNPDESRKVVSLGLIDNNNEKTFLLEATPDITTQLTYLKKAANFNAEDLSNGVFLTHAHIGHYTGLMYYGKEAINADCIPVFAMPKMKSFLEQNGPWSQLVSQRNIELRELTNETSVSLTNTISVTPFTVPHRDEFSETVGYKINGQTNTALFIPDIDKWSKWDKSIIMEIEKVDFAFVDATFYSGDELKTRDISQIPHPFVSETMELFDELPDSTKNKIYFIHFNHTNPLLNPESNASKEVLNRGYHIARLGDTFDL